MTPAQLFWILMNLFPLKCLKCEAPSLCIPKAVLVSTQQVLLPKLVAPKSFSRKRYFKKLKPSRTRELAFWDSFQNISSLENSEDSCHLQGMNCRTSHPEASFFSAPRDDQMSSVQKLPLLMLCLWIWASSFCLFPSFGTVSVCALDTALHLACRLSASQAYVTRKETLKLSHPEGMSGLTCAQTVSHLKA